jgi:putative SOS response-associated peptidase YedK
VGHFGWPQEPQLDGKGNYGFVYHRDERVAAAIGSRMINARADTVAVKPAFREAFRRRRCLMVADGFYEWQKTNGKKQPYFIGMKDESPFAFAGLWETWGE